MLSSRQAERPEKREVGHMNKYEQIAADVLKKVGGKENISFATHCMTRLRLNLKDETVVNQAAVKEIDGVLGCQFSGGQFHVIIGNSVNKVYPVFCEIAGIEQQKGAKENLDANEKEPLTVKGVLNKILDGITGSITPALPILIAAGMIRMIVSLIGPGLLGLVSDSSNIYVLLTFVSDAGFYFFPFYIGYAAAQKFGVTPMLALFLAGVMMHPTLLQLVADEASFTVYGIPMAPVNYATTVFPILMSVWVMSLVEKFLKKHIPDVLSTMAIPTLTMLIMVPLALCVLGPLGNFLGTYIGEFLVWLYNVFGAFGVAVIGGLWLFVVATGMHLPLIATATVSIATLGYDAAILPGAMLSIYSDLGVALAILLRAKDAKTRELAGSCLASQALGGVGEPTIFGLLMRYRKAFAWAMVGGFAGGLYLGITKAAVYAFAATNFMTFLCYAGGEASQFMNGVIGCLITLVVSFVLTFVFGFETKDKAGA